MIFVLNQNLRVLRRVNRLTCIRTWPDRRSWVDFLRSLNISFTFMYLKIHGALVICVVILPFNFKKKFSKREKSAFLQ